MSIFDTFKSLANTKSAVIGIGLGEEGIHNDKIVEVCLRFVETFDSIIHIFGYNAHISNLNEELKQRIKNNSLILVKSANPEEEIINALKTGKINALVRGCMSSSKFLNILKERFKIKTITRLALLETINGIQFFYGPVGIDECNTYGEKMDFIEKAIKEFSKLTITPKISILSGGRMGDLGRDEKIDGSIKMAEEIVKHFSELNISHDEILIEKAIEKKANLIIAPDGISGNLIYRTLVHLGGGNAYGAIYMGLDKIVIDTSRVGKSKEIEGALLLALALS